MKSKLLEAYKLLGLEVGDEIKVEGRDNIYVVLKDGIGEKGWGGMRFKSLLAELLGGEHKFTKISKPLKECTKIELIKELASRPGVSYAATTSGFFEIECDISEG